ncbi:MAG TPA: sulfotransferase [Steroidobacteraceae bacterium]|nr:sulfotransferase [Steroidobacteraceae bacterium]
MAASNDPGDLLRQAAMLERSGQFAEAEAAYLRVLARRPDLPDTWYNLGLLQRRTGQFDKALASYREALNRGVSQPEEVHLNRGVIYSDHLRLDEAAAQELNTALEINPDYVPALFNLANLHEDFGRRTPALALYERILALQPGDPAALARYANLQSITEPDDTLIARLRVALAGHAATDADKAALGFALGRLLDACGQYDAAFDAYTAANRHSRASASPGAAAYDRKLHEHFIERVIEVFAPGRVKPVAPTLSAPPLFICGMFRSGSTLTEQVLAAHARVTAGGEIDFLPNLVRTRLAPFPERLLQTSAAELEVFAAEYTSTLGRLFPGADRITDKRPDNFLHLGLIKTLLPDAKIVHTTRDPLDNCLSIYFLHLDHGMGYALDLMDIGHYYVGYRRLMTHWKSLYGADILDFDYDALVRDPRPAIEKLLAFCGLDWDENCLAFERVVNAVKTASVWQVREPLYRRSSGRWKNYERQLAGLREYLAKASL